MRTIFKGILSILVVMLFSQTLMADEKEDLKLHFSQKLESVKKILQQKELSIEEKGEKLTKLLVPLFDFELMAKLSLGKKHWRGLSPEKQKEFIDIYTNRMKNSYLSKLDSYNDQLIKIVSVEQKKRRILINTYMESDDKNIDVVYKFYKPKKPKPNKEKWLIYDVEIIGVSILKADKAQFKDFLQTKTLDELMQVLAKQE